MAVRYEEDFPELPRLFSSVGDCRHSLWTLAYLRSKVAISVIVLPHRAVLAWFLNLWSREERLGLAHIFADDIDIMPITTLLSAQIAER